MSTQPVSIFLASKGPQTGSKTMTAVEQHELALTPGTGPGGGAGGVGAQQAHRQCSFHPGLRHVRSGGQGIYLALGVDAGYFSNIKKGKATLQADIVANFCALVGNTVYLEWLAYQVGCQLVVIKSEAERRAEIAERSRDEALAENRLMKQLLQARAAS